MDHLFRKHDKVTSTGKAAWFEKGSGTFVRSTLRALRAKVPDPFSNHAGKAVMKHTPLFLALWLALGIGIAPAAEWQAAKGPLATRWAKDVSPDKALPEYPRPQLVRKAWLNLNGLWQLGFAKQGEEPPAGKDLAEQILVPFPVEAALSGVMKPADRVWYRCTFTLPKEKEWTGKRILLHFGAVNWEATVWLNG